MKNSKEIADAVFKARDRYMEQKQISSRRIRTAAAVSGTVCALGLTIAGIGYLNPMQNSRPSVTAVTTDTEREMVSDMQSLEVQKEESMETEAQETTLSSAEKKKTTETAAGIPSEPADTQAVHTQPEIPAAAVPETESVDPIGTDAPAAGNTTEPPAQTEPPLSERTEETTTETEELFEVPRWDEKTISEQFVEFTVDGAIYVTRCVKISNAHVGEKLYDTIVTGYDEYADEIRCADASVYRIEGISAECAVSVYFQGQDTGYVYTNRRYSPETLGEMMEDMRLDETISFHTLYSAQDGMWITDYDVSLLMELLNGHRDLARLEDDTYHKPLFSVSTNVELLGITNKSLRVTEDGYLITNIMERGYTFYIGEETAAALAQALGLEKDDTSDAQTTDAVIVTTPASEPMEEVIVFE